MRKHNQIHTLGAPHYKVAEAVEEPSAAGEIDAEPSETTGAPEELSEEAPPEQESHDAQQQQQQDDLAAGDAPEAGGEPEEPMEADAGEPAAEASQDIPPNEEENEEKQPAPEQEPQETSTEGAEQMEVKPDETDNKESEDNQPESAPVEKVNGEEAEESAPKEKKETKAESREIESHSRKRRYDDERRQRYEDRYAPPPEEPEEEFDDALVVFDKYNSDLNMKFHRDRLTAHPLTLESFAYLWAGVKATYGVNAGKVCFECKLAEENSVRHLPSDEPSPHLVRVGWSTDACVALVGEEELSFAYCGTGKKVNNATCEDYGESFKGGDVIGCYLDLSGEENFTVTYTKNGKNLGVAFTAEKSKLADAALFPHVITRNTTTECNFGSKETPYFQHPEDLADYVFLGNVPLEERTRGTVGPSAKKECEVLMLCGLPGAGKTFFANKHTKDNPEKRFNILGTSYLLTRMKVTGIERKTARLTAREILHHAGNCLTRLLQMSCRKRRNFILDQGFQRKAVVIVPTDEDFKSRVDKQTKDEGREIPDIAVYEMKAGFSMPEKGDNFEEVLFPELPKDDAVKQIEKYRADAKKHGPPPEKRFRGGFDTGRQMGRGGWGGGFGGRDMAMPRMPFGRGGGRGFGGGGGSYNRFGGGGGNYNRFGGGGGNFNRFGGGGQGGYGSRDSGRSGFGADRRNFGGQGGGGGNRNAGNGGGSWQQNRGGRSNSQGSFGGNRSGGGGTGLGSGGLGGGFNRNNAQRGRSNMNNRTGGGGFQGNRNSGASSYQQKNQQQNRSQRNQTTINYHQAYQQQTAQLHASASASGQQSSTPASAQSYSQAYGAQAQPDYSQQWAQYYQQQAAAQQQQQAAAAAAAQYQNYYAYQQAYGGQTR